MYVSVIINISRVLAYHHHLVGIYGHIGVQVALSRIQPVASQSRCSIVVNLILIVQLLGIEHLFARHRIGYVKAFKGSLLILVRLTGQRLAPVEVRSDGVAVLIFRNHIGFIAAIRRVGQASAQDRVAHVVHKLAIHRVRHLVFVHPFREDT